MTVHLANEASHMQDNSPASNRVRKNAPVCCDLFPANISQAVIHQALTGVPVMPLPFISSC